MKNEIYSVIVAGFPITISSQPHGYFTVTYGAQVKSDLNRSEAAKEFGQCLFHALECDGRLDNTPAPEPVTVAPAPVLGEQSITDAELASFLVELNRVRKADHVVRFPDSEKDADHPLNYDNFCVIDAEVGPKFIKLSVTETKRGSSVQRQAPSGRFIKSAYAFLVRANGDILKAASWKAPAKGVRGNIRKTWWEVSLNQYGAVYLR